MNFWDSSALLPLLVHETATAALLKLRRRDPAMVVWWGSEIECVSALSRLEREYPANAAVIESALRRLDSLRGRWNEILPVPAVRETARRLLRVHPLRAADSLQLAAAIVAAENRPVSLGFVCLDHRLIDAAKREGFAVVAG